FYFIRFDRCISRHIMFSLSFRNVIKALAVRRYQLIVCHHSMAPDIPQKAKHQPVGNHWKENMYHKSTARHLAFPGVQSQTVPPENVLRSASPSQFLRYRMFQEKLGYKHSSWASL